MEAYANLIQAIDGLRKQGYDEDFNLKQNCLECKKRGFKIFQEDFVVDKYFRFDNATDPDDQSIIYAISSPKHEAKGILINSYGIYSDEVTNQMTKKLKIT